MKQQLEPIPEKTRAHNTEPKEDLQPGTQYTEPSLDYLSNLKAFLTALVILHHTAVFYGGAGHLPYHSTSSPSGSEPILVAFNAVNQTFLMALFFFIAGFFSQRSLARRTERTGEREGSVGGGPKRFIMDRFRRLAVPTVLYTLLGPAFCRVAVELGRGREVRAEDVRAEVRTARGVRGPVWFCALLLIFDTLLAASWTCHPQGLVVGIGETSTKVEQNSHPASSIHGPQLFAALALLTTIDFLWRLYFPIGQIFAPLNLNLGYLPQYIAAYTFGVRTQNPEYVVPSVRSLCVLVAVSLGSSALLARSVSSTADGASRGEALGGWNTFAAVYAVWNNSTGYLIGAALLNCFRRHATSPCKRMSSLAYTAFLVHIPISLLMCVSLERWVAGTVVKTFIVGTLNIVASWAVAWAWDVGLSKCRLGGETTPTTKVEARAGSAPQHSRRRTLSKGEKALEILEGLDEVGC